MTTSSVQTRVIGFDPSLTSSGVASNLGWTDTIRPKKIRGLERLRNIIDAVRSYTSGCDLVVMEGPSYGHSGFRQHEELVALRWMVRDLLDRKGIPVAIVPPSSLKLWATGKGNASKDDVAEAMDEQHPGRTPGFLAGKRHDEADALALAEMGAGWIDQWDLSPERQRSVDGVSWPQVLEVAR